MSATWFINNEKLIKFQGAHSERLLDTVRSLSVDDEKLKLDGTILKFKNVVEGHFYERDIDLGDIWLPGSGGFEHPVPLLLYPHHTQTLIRRIDLFAQGVPSTPSFTHSAPVVFTNAVKFIEWALLNDHYLLSEISENDIEQLQKDLKAGGIPQMLQIPKRINAYWEHIKDDQGAIEGIIHYKHSKIDSINTARLSRLLGSAGLSKTIPNNFYQNIASKLREKGYVIRGRFANAGVSGITQPAAKTLNTLFTQWNEMAKMDEGDHLNLYPFPNPYSLSQKLGTANKRTRNLHADQVVQLLGNAHLWLYKASPLIIKVVQELKSAVNKEGSKRHYSETIVEQVLEKSTALKKLERLIGVKVYRSCANQHHKCNHNEWTMVDCITALMSACFIVLQIYNARRATEIQDPIIGISNPEHFRCVDEIYDWYQACFYNAKHGGRYWYTLNKGSTKAFKVLFELKKAWDTNNTQGLFNVPSFTLDAEHNIKSLKFNYNKGKGSRLTGDRFLQFVLGDEWKDAKGTHVFRRIYALIYFYQYENRELLSLCHQLGHIDPGVTEVYVTEPAAREQHEQLHHKIKLTNVEKLETIKLIKEENKALDKLIATVDIEKTSEDILGLMMGNKRMAGRYPAYLKRVFKVLSKSVKFNKKMQSLHKSDFADLMPEQQSEEVAQVLSERGHRSQPKPHSTCHRAPHIARSLDLPCEPSTCKGCPYQEVKQAHLEIMVEDLTELREVADNADNDLLTRIRAEESARSLALLIKQHERTMERNETRFSTS
ncbi:hypothetical protein VSAK1_08321 [Vibrio mediterranei AK1]|uniref:hypothetical protein n=1 Tax=Vibrio mediterranei TaxID=689 RepID=UPI0001541DC5|nr:hypothetical protein [Vibrio mediterranei]EDL54000.1 hypothetical protein VSAK1_08321 [Vibrio mediterranei AK1]